jgi:hypothetical protein
MLQGNRGAALHGGGLGVGNGGFFEEHSNMSQVCVFKVNVGSTLINKFQHVAEHGPSI